MRLAGSLLTIILVAAVAAAPADAYRLGGKKWPTRTITYHVLDPTWKRAVDQAARAWNASGMRARFRSAPRRRAKLLVYGRGRAGSPEALSGNATLGWAPVMTYRLIDGVEIRGGETLRCGTRLRRPGGGFHRVTCVTRGPGVWLDRVRPSLIRTPVDHARMVALAAHELGHSLGLHHSKPRCAVMHATSDTTRCRPAPNPWQYRCRVLDTDDVRGAIRRYGGKLRPLAAEFCDAYAPLLAPASLTVHRDPAAPGVVEVRWTAAPNLPPGAFVRAMGQPGECPARFEPDEWAGTGADAWPWLQFVAPGRHCVVAWTYLDGQVSPPLMVAFDVP